MKNLKRTIQNYQLGREAARKNEKQNPPTDSGMARRLYLDGLKDYRNNKVAH